MGNFLGDCLVLVHLLGRLAVQSVGSVVYFFVLLVVHRLHALHCLRLIGLVGNWFWKLEGIDGRWFG
jgi:hypothetical protein